MKGNVFISLNTETYKKKIPAELQERYNWTETDEDGNETTITPTFEELAEKYGQYYGTPIKIKVGQRNIYIVELTASWLKSEVSALLALGDGLEYPQNTLLTAGEASQLSADNAPEDH